MKLFFMFSTSILFASEITREQLIREKIPNFSLKMSELKEGRIQHFYELVSPNGKPVNEDDAFNQSHGVALSESFVEAIDLSKVTHQKRDQLYTLYTRVSFSVEANLDFLNDTFFCSKPLTLKLAKIADKNIRIKSTSPCSYKQTGGLFIPNQKLEISSYNLERPAPYFKDMELNGLGAPHFSRFQFHSEFGRVFFYKAGYFSTVVTNFHKVSETESIVDIHTFHLLHNIPPKIGGGPEWVKKQILKQYPKLKQVFSKVLVNP